MGKFPEVLNFNWLFLELNRFICNLTAGSSRTYSRCKHIKKKANICHPSKGIRIRADTIILVHLCPSPLHPCIWLDDPDHSKLFTQHAHRQQIVLELWKSDCMNVHVPLRFQNPKLCIAFDNLHKGSKDDQVQSGFACRHSYAMIHHNNRARSTTLTTRIRTQV